MIIMKRQTIKKIISRLIIFVFVVSFFQLSLPIQATTDTSMSSLYSNPNQSSNNAYKFKVSDVVSSGLLTNVVGCTGVVNKASGWMIKFIQSPVQQTKILLDKFKQIKNGLKSACSSTKAGAQLGAGSIPIINDLVSTVNTIFGKISVNVDTLADLASKAKSLGLAPPPGGSGSKEKICLEQVEALNSDQLNQMVKDAEKQNEIALKEQCFDGIAITLAKNQLTAMTRSMMNWVNSGYGGNPFFVQNMRNFTYNIERNVLETGIDILLSPGNQNPYAYDFARSTVTGRGLVSSSSKFLGGLKSDLGAFITSPESYYTDEQLYQAENTEIALLRAQQANYAFANDFSVGGWNGWLALTQRDQNNPLGFTMLASQYLADMQMQGVTEAKDELAQNDGFMSQKTCIKWQKYGTDGNPVYDEVAGLQTEGTTISLPILLNNDPKDGFSPCVDWKVITPGTLIAEKTKSYLNSPERQLELVKTINDGLNFLFASLLSKLEGGGLVGLSDGWTSPINWTDNMNDWTDNMNELTTSSDGNTPYNNNGAYDGFNLTRDLGNNYIHATPVLLGTWNAKTNIAIANPENTTYLLKKGANGKIKLYPDTAPEVYKEETTGGDTELSNDLYGNLANPINGYYTVNNGINSGGVIGKTKLILEGYNGWAEGDRAFWNGSEWQNWKKGQTNPIKKRGVIQVQQDYIVAGKEILGVLPNVMTKLGELDYCLPGPNPSYKTNSTDAQSAYQDWIGSMYVGPRDEYRTEWRIDDIGSRTYNNLANIFVDNPNTWQAFLNSSFMPLLNSFVKNFNGGQNYHYKAEKNEKEGKDIKNRMELMEKTFDYVNNHLFQDFYKAFDEKMNRIYFNSMTNKYSDTEVSIGENSNLGYIPMAESGLDLTKNILYYNDDITKAVQDYTDAMNQAKINIAKLEPIKTEVSGIILAAQKRRDENRDKLLTKYKITLAEYNKCATEENMSFYDADTITNMGSANAENCIDGIDNDLNGLIDMKDPVCPGYTGSRRTGDTGSRRN